MPTENELKYVMVLNDSLQESIEDSADDCYMLAQGYMHRKSKLTIRVRRQHEVATGNTRHFLQTKLKVGKSVDFAKYIIDMEVVANGPPRVVEVSKEISQRDFVDFWRKAKGRVHKSRYMIYSETTDQYKNDRGEPWREIWEVDFFKEPNGAVYFVMAECELPEGVNSPLFEIPAIIKDNIVYSVPLSDTRFSSSRLGNVEYAKAMYESLV